MASPLRSGYVMFLCLSIAVLFLGAANAQRIPEPPTPHYPQSSFVATQPFDGSRPIHIFCVGCSAGIGLNFTVEACKLPNVQVTACARRDEGNHCDEVHFPRDQCHSSSSISYFNCDVEESHSIAKIPQRVRKLRGNAVKFDHVFLNVGRGNLGLVRSLTMDQMTTLAKVTALGKQEVYRVVRNAGLVYINDTVTNRKSRFTYASTLGSFIPGIDWQGGYVAAKLMELGLIYSNMNEDGNYLEFTMGSPTAVCCTEYVQAAIKAQNTNCPYAEDVGVSSNAQVLAGSANTPQIVAQGYLQTMQTLYSQLPSRRFILSSLGTSVGFPVSDRLIATSINMASLDHMNNATDWIENQIVGTYFGTRPTGVRNAKSWCPEQ